MGKSNLGVTDRKLAPMPASPNAVSTQAEEAGKRVEPLTMAGSVAETREKILACLEQMGGNKITTDTGDYIHTVFVTRLLRFRDDVEFYIDGSQGQVHFRSASRVGYSDLGANRRRYEAFKTLYQQN